MSNCYVNPNGTCAGLEAVVRHHLNAAESLERYDGDQLLAFLQALTSPSSVDLSCLVPDSVPSGLPVWD